MIHIEQLEKELDAVFFKKELLTRLHEAGIPEFDISIRMASEKTSNKRSDIIGFYRSFSQFISKPYMSLSLKNTYKSLLEYDLISDDDSYNNIKMNVTSHMIDTICHEYGHVIEEYLHVSFRDLDRSNESEDNKLRVKSVFKFFKENYIDNEDFAEKFGIWLSRKDCFIDEGSLYKVIDFYCENLFTEYSRNWIKLEKKEREIIFSLDNAKRMEKWTKNDMDLVGKSLPICNDVIKILEKNSDIKSLKIMKLSNPINYDNFTEKAIKFEHYCHNVVEVKMDQKTFYLDMLYEQTSSKNLSTKEEIELNWKTISECNLIKTKKNKV